VLGTVTGLHRYPVKSLLGEGVAGSDVTDRGLAHDRGLALVDRETGKVASAKNPRLWRGLLAFAAEHTGAAVRIRTLDGKTFRSTDPGIDETLSGLLGRPVTLTRTAPPDATLDRARPEEVLRAGVTAPVPVDTSVIGSAAPPGTFFDFAPLHLITASTLDRVARLSPRGTVERQRYRPNLVIRTDEPGFAENAWVDRDLRIGDELVLRVIARTPRCAVPTLAHGDLPRDTDALRVPADHNRVRPLAAMEPMPCAGAYAQVLHPGRIRRGDPVRWA
jgi:uncharacterized protein